MKPTNVPLVFLMTTSLCLAIPAKTIPTTEDQLEGFPDNQKQHQRSTTRPVFHWGRRINLQDVTIAKSTSSTEKSDAAFGSTNISFRSTIDTPNNLNAALARTQPMSSAFAQTEPAFSTPQVAATAVAPLEKSNFDSLPLPVGTLADESKTNWLGHNNDRTVNNRFRLKTRIQRVKLTSNCPDCHPNFLVDFIRCSPCLLLS